MHPCHPTDWKIETFYFHFSHFFLSLFAQHLQLYLETLHNSCTIPAIMIKVCIIFAWDVKNRRVWHVRREIERNRKEKMGGRGKGEWDKGIQKQMSNEQQCNYWYMTNTCDVCQRKWLLSNEDMKTQNTNMTDDHFSIRLMPGLFTKCNHLPPIHFCCWWWCCCFNKFVYLWLRNQLS